MTGAIAPGTMIVGLLALCLLSAPPVHGQVRPEPGSAVRLHVRGERSPVRGALSGGTSEEWTLVLGSGEMRTVAAEDVARAEVRVTRRNTVRGALIGTIVTSESWMPALLPRAGGGPGLRWSVPLGR